VLVVVFTLLVPVAGFLAFFGAVLVRQAVELAARVPEWWEAAATGVRERWPELQEFFQTPFGRRVQEALTGMQEDALAGLGGVGGTAVAAGAGVVKGVGSLLAWAVLPVYFIFFLLVDPRRVDGAQVLPFLKPETRNDVLYLVRHFVDLVVAFFRGQLVVAFLQGILYAIGFAAVGLRYGILIGLLLGFLNVIPYLGSIIGLAITMPLALFQEEGGWARLAMVLAVIIVVQLIEGYILTPRIMGERTGLHPLAIIVAVFFWGQALGGIMGMIFAIPLTAFLVSVWGLLREKYMTEIV
jgi:predicted PurR-regulated permease PerM